MGVLVVVGAQWGDEGKGKVVDVLTESADVAARYGGGANAGHTLVVNGKRTVIRLVPSAILQPRPLCVLGPGMVIDPAVLRHELDTLASYGVDTSSTRVRISRHAHVVMPYHVAIDSLRESTARAIGTTKRGIGPAYEDKVGRRGIRMADLLDRSALEERIVAALESWAPTIRALGGEVPVASDIVAEYAAHGEALESRIADTTSLLHDSVRRGDRIVAEGAQGTLLDIDHGTYPFVTSSTVLASGAASGLGVGPTSIDRVVGITKAYATRVGSGPFPTELHDPTGEQIRRQGGEFGSVTGRPRRCGWLDLVALRHAARLNGLTELALTKADVLSGVGEVFVGVGYLVEGRETREMPPDLTRATPILKSLGRFDEPLSQCRSISALPRTVRLLMDEVESATDTPIRLLSVGPEREATIRIE